MPQFGAPQPQAQSPFGAPQQQPQPQFQSQPSMQAQPYAQPGYAAPVAPATPVTSTTPNGQAAPAAPNNLFVAAPPAHDKKKWVIMTVVFIATTIIAASLGVWALMQYGQQKTTVDSQVQSAVADAVKKQSDTDAANFLEKEKQPYRQFAGPDDYGTLGFEYPKIWSIYIAGDASSRGTYSAYFNPVSVPPISQNERYALRVTIEDKDYDKVIESYKSLVSSGKLKAGTFQLNEDTNGTRLDGEFTKDIRGSAVIFKIRDKTATLRTDAETFVPDFDKLIKTVQFNK